MNPRTRKAAVYTIGAIAILVIANALLSGHSTQMARPPSASRTRRRRIRSFGNSPRGVCSEGARFGKGCSVVGGGMAETRADGMVTAAQMTLPRHGE